MNMGIGKTQINDESGDKKYFTIIPNYILNHSILYDREVYIQMKRITGESGTCWTSQTNLAKQCGISINRLKKSIKYLVDHNWIKYKGKKTVYTKGGEQEVNEYSVSDLWKMNNTFYEDKGVSTNDTPITKGVSRDDQRGVTNKPKGVSPDDDKEEPLEEEPIKKNSIPTQIELLILKYINVEKIKNKTNQIYITKLYNSLGKDISKVEGLLKAVKYFSTTEYPYTIYSVRSLYEKKDKIIARILQVKQSNENKKSIVGKVAPAFNPNKNYG